FEPEDLHHLTDGMAAGRGVVLALPQLANWDLAGAWVTTRLGIPFTTVAERLKPETLYDRFVAYRAGLGMEVLPHSGAPPSAPWPAGCVTPAWSAWSPTGTCPRRGSTSTSSARPRGCPPAPPCSRCRPGHGCCR